MSFDPGSRSVLRKAGLVLALTAMSVFAWGQHEKESKESREPAHASKPSRPSNPRPSNPRPSNPNRGSTPSREGAPNRAERPSPDRGERPGNTPAVRPDRQPGNRPGNGSGNNQGRPANTPGNRGGTTPGNRGGNTPGNRGGNTPGNRPGNPGGNRGGNTPGNRAGMGRPAPGRTVSLKGGGSANLRPNGQIRSVNRNGMQIQRNLRGGRTIVTERNGARIVTTGRDRGYVQRAYVVRGGRSYYSRTYYDHGVYRVGVYRGYYWGGNRYYGYYPSYWYRPAFYGWAYRPWGAPVYWGIGVGGWGWGGAPWFGFYGGYFAPYPAYPSAAFWLTDYLIAANLQAAYSSQQYADTGSDAGSYDQGSANYSDGGGQAAANSGQVTLTPEVKQAIAEEVRAQLEQQQQQSSAPDNSSSGQAQGAAASPTGDDAPPPALDPARRTFVVSSDITVMADGEECELTAGDVITRLTDTPDSNQNVNASVQASKKNDCAAGKQVAVSVDALQDMYNHFQEQLDSGMKALAEKQGTGGLPKAPDTSTTATDVPPPQPDKEAAQELTDQQTAADQTETQVKQEAATGPGGQ